MPQDLTGDKSTLIQLMARCRQATSHYLYQCWPRSPMPYGITRPQWVNMLKPRQTCYHFTDDIFKCIFFKKNVWMLHKISQKYVPKMLIHNIPALDDTEPLSEPMMASLLMPICVTWPEHVKQHTIQQRTFQDHRLIWNNLVQKDVVSIV